MAVGRRLRILTNLQSRKACETSFNRRQVEVATLKLKHWYEQRFNVPNVRNVVVS